MQKRIIKEILVTISEIGMAFLSLWFGLKVGGTMVYLFALFAGIFSFLSVWELIIVVNEINK